MTPNDRAKRLTAGPAETSAALEVEVSINTRSGFAGAVDSTVWIFCGAGISGSAALGADLVSLLDSTAVSDSSVSRTKIISPSETLSPTLSVIENTVPALGEGISIVALSVSNVTKDVSSSTRSPGLTKSSITSTPLAPPISGTTIFCFPIVSSSIFYSFNIIAPNWWAR